MDEWMDGKIDRGMHVNDLTGSFGLGVDLEVPEDDDTSNEKDGHRNDDDGSNDTWMKVIVVVIARLMMITTTMITFPTIARL